MNTVELKDMFGGALQEKFQHSFERVMENLLDEKTPARDKREIIIKMTFVQNSERDDVACSVKVEEKLVGQSEAVTNFSIGKYGENGPIYVNEYHGRQIKGQMNIDDETSPEYEDTPYGTVVRVK